jgi:hypothetical protein
VSGLSPAERYIIDLAFDKGRIDVLDKFITVNVSSPAISTTKSYPELRALSSMKRQKGGFTIDEDILLVAGARELPGRKAKSIADRRNTLRKNGISVPRKNTSIVRTNTEETKLNEEPEQELQEVLIDGSSYLNRLLEGRGNNE